MVFRLDVESAAEGFGCRLAASAGRALGNACWVVEFHVQTTETTTVRVVGRWRRDAAEYVFTMTCLESPLSMPLQGYHLTVYLMEAVLWYVFTGTRGGENRARILRALDDRPRNANQLAEDLELDYKTVRHHLDVLADNDIVEKSGDDYGAIYLPTDRVRHNWGTVEQILEQVN